MIKIANRGNFQGRNPDKENTTNYVELALASGYSVKLDVWLIDRDWYLGYDFPREKIEVGYLENPKFWVHARNLEAYVSLYDNNRVHVLWHNRDQYTYTNHGIKWAHSGVITFDGVMNLEDSDLDFKYKIKTGQLSPLAVCCDNFNFLDNN